uniref:Pentatricopeptide repeat-containing protein n=1 Tax=Noccaea caerulescens TaxID=107243 RepID=A0A1J3E516_NOCCA
MRRLFAITAKGRQILEKGNPGTVPSLCGFCCWTTRAFSGGSYDYREKMRGGFLQDAKLDDAIGLFSEMEMISSGVASDTITFRIMLAGLCSKEELPNAVAMLVDLQMSVDGE